jgi:hypothetical protein
VPELEGWILSGDTGLALQMGHRVSEDLDFFRTKQFPAGRVAEILGRIGTVGILLEDERNLTVIVSATKISFVTLTDEFLFPGRPYRFCQLADPRDIALMKLAAISGGGKREDFIDLYTILQGGLSLEQCCQWLPLKFGEGQINTYHVLKSLTYFEDSEGEPMPRMLEPFDWTECKNFFIREAHAIVLP